MCRGEMAGTHHLQINSHSFSKNTKFYLLFINVWLPFQPSLESNLQIVFHDLILNFESNTPTNRPTIFLGVNKTFHIVPNQRILYKLDHYRIRRTTLLWILNFRNAKSSCRWQLFRYRSCYVRSATRKSTRPPPFSDDLSLLRSPLRFAFL